jgi:group I intron endonuclease
MPFISFCGFRIHSDNTPLNRAGLYLITNMLNGKKYVGITISMLRRTRTHGARREKTKLARALRKYGKENFLFEPILYCISEYDATWLCQTEADKIIEYNSINDGYNIIAAKGRVGPYGESFAELIAAAHARKTPEERSAIARRAKATMTPIERREAALKGSLAPGNDPKLKAERMRSLRVSQSPERRRQIGRSGGLASTANRTSEQKRQSGIILTESYRLLVTPEERREAFNKGLGKLTAVQLSENGRKGVAIINANRTSSERSALARKAGKARFAAMSPAERSVLAKKANTSAILALAKKTSEERSAIAIKGVATRRARGIITTVHKGGRWINNGNIRKRLRIDELLPTGWSCGWHLSNRE